MDKIPFAQFVLNDIATNGAFIIDNFMGEESVIPNRLDDHDERFPKGHWFRRKEREDRDDWALYAGWDLFGYKATIVRGPENFIIKVRGELALELLKAQDKLFAERKARRKAAKLARKQKELDAAWWP